MCGIENNLGNCVFIYSVLHEPFVKSLYQSELFLFLCVCSLTGVSALDKVVAAIIYHTNTIVSNFIMCWKHEYKTICDYIIFAIVYGWFSSARLLERTFAPLIRLHVVFYLVLL